MKTLKNVAVGQTVTVKKLTGEGPFQETDHGHGITKGVEIPRRKSGAPWRPG